jgi:hypothetical protein
MDSDHTAKLKSGILALMHEDLRYRSAFASDYDIGILTACDSKDLVGFNIWILLLTSAHCGLRLILKMTHCKSWSCLRFNYM